MPLLWYLTWLYAPTQFLSSFSTQWFAAYTDSALHPPPLLPTIQEKNIYKGYVHDCSFVHVWCIVCISILSGVW